MARECLDPKLFWGSFGASTVGTGSSFEDFVKEVERCGAFPRAPLACSISLVKQVGGVGLVVVVAGEVGYITSSPTSCKHM